MKKTLTISIAAYHVEKYLAECLDSFALSDIAEHLEVLVINDGSGDEINQITNHYVNRFPSIFRLIDKENGGHGSTVNCGIEEACGDYFKTVDGDDFVSSEGIRSLISFLRQTTADLVVTNYQSFDDKSRTILEEYLSDFDGIQFDKVYDFNDVADNVYINMHAATFRTSILKNMAERLDEHCFYVDAEYILYPIPAVKTIAFLNENVYMYRLGMTTQSMNILNMQRNCAHHETVLKHLLKFYTKKTSDASHVLSEQQKNYIAKGIARIATSQTKIYLSYPAGKDRKLQIKALDNNLKANCPEIYKRMKHPAIKLMRYSNYLLYRFASFLCKKAYHC